jgi:AraC-like DNA-binding protein/ligand-binding sensor protein
MVARNELTESPPPDVPNVRAAMVRCLQQSKLFREYREAFEATTGLPLVLRAAGAFQAPLEGSKHTNPFCALMIQSNKTCAACLQLQQRAEKDAVLEAKTLQCHAGLSESVVPVRVGHLVLAYLQTGQVFLRTPSKRRFKIISAAIPGGASDGVKTAYLKTRVMPRKQYQAIIRLLVVFAEHLATVSNQLLTSQATTELPVITKVRTFISLHQDEALSLNDAAHAVNMSQFYFCKVFKKSTGLTFTEYLARARIEAVKHMLLDAHMRVSEAAYASGFQSLSQFNRVFLRVAGEAPRRYRDRLHEANTRP